MHKFQQYHYMGHMTLFDDAIESIHTNYVEYNVITNKLMYWNNTDPRHNKVCHVLDLKIFIDCNAHNVQKTKARALTTPSSIIQHSIVGTFQLGRSCVFD